MFAVTRPHRQLVATLVLLVATVAPTVLIATISWRLNRPSHPREVAGEFSRQLGLIASIEAIRHLRPGEDELNGVVLRLEEPSAKEAASPSRELASAARVVVTRSSGDVGIKTPALTLRSESLESAFTQVTELLRRAGGDCPTRASLIAQTCDIELGAGVRYQLRDLAAVYQHGAAGPTVTASFFIQSDGPRSRSELSLVRDRRGDAVLTTVTFRTMDGPLPARVLSPFFDANAWLGAGALFAGELTFRRHGVEPWEAEFHGELSEVDLAALVGQHFDRYHLSGQAKIALTSARWSQRPNGQGSGWVDVRGRLTAGPGTVSTSMLEALNSELKFRVPEQRDSRRAEWDYQNLGLSFSMGSDGQLRLDGCLGAEYAPGSVIVHGARGVALAKAPAGLANVRGLWKMLFPAQGDELVPGTPESQILRSLPLPPTQLGRVERLDAN